MLGTKQTVNSLALIAMALILLRSDIYFYYSSGLISRIVLISTFLFFLITLVIIGLDKFKKSFNSKIIIALLCLTSLFFLLWHSQFFTQYFSEFVLHSDTFVFSQEYSISNSLVFNTPHSYFFMLPLIVHLFQDLGLTNDVIVYLLLALYGFLVSILGILVFESTQKQLLRVDKQKRSLSTLPGLISFMAISFAYSARGSLAVGFPLILSLITIWFFMSHKIKNRTEIVFILFLAVGLTFGNQDGIILMSTFFLIYLFFDRKSSMIYALIPLGYLVFFCTAYMQLFVSYVNIAISGFQDFFHRLLSSQSTARILPWERTSSIPQSDVYVSSAANIATLILCVFFSSIILFFMFTKKNNLPKNEEKDEHFERVWLVWLLLWLSVTLITYIGVSTVSETPSSDTRTIVVILLSEILMFAFISTRLFEYINRIPAKKILMICLIGLIGLASLSSIFASHPLSANDPRLVVEDDWSSVNGVYAVSSFINSYFPNGGIVADYEVLNHINPYISSGNYETRLLNAATIDEVFQIHHYQIVVIYASAGESYPSLDQTPEDYSAATNFANNNDLIYNNGIVTISQPLNALAG